MYSDMRLEFTLDKNFCYTAIVKEYDAKTRRVAVSPTFKHKIMPDVWEEPIIIYNIPVVYMQTAKGGVHIPLKEGDQVLIVCSQHSLEKWKNKGDEHIEDNDMRRCSITDSICIPGLFATGFNENIDTDECLSVYHDDRVKLSTKKNNFELKGDIDLSANDNSKINIGNSISSLGKILSDVLEEIIAMKTVGSPATHSLSPDNIAKFQMYLETLKQVFKV